MIGQLLCLGVLLAASVPPSAPAAPLQVGPKAPYQAPTAAVGASAADGGAIRAGARRVGGKSHHHQAEHPHLTGVGKGKRPEDVVVVWNDGAVDAGGTSKSFTLNVWGHRFRLEG